jgi:hypothetical protein
MFGERLFASLALDASVPNLNYKDPTTGEQVEVAYEAIGGVPFELGALWVPEGRPFQIGLRLRGRRECEARSVVSSIDPFPGSVVYPGEWSAGVAFKLGERLPEGSGEWFDRALVDLDVRGVFPVSGTTGFERLRSTQPSELLEDPLVQPALGVELELYTRIAWLWLGTYREPARYADVEGRAHVTGGVKLRLFKVKDFSFYLSAASDSADRYDVWTVSFGTSPGRW